MGKNYDMLGGMVIIVGAIVLMNVLLKIKFGTIFFYIGSLIGVVILILGINFLVFKK